VHRHFLEVAQRCEERQRHDRALAQREPGPGRALPTTEGSESDKGSKRDKGKGASEQRHPAASGEGIDEMDPARGAPKDELETVARKGRAEARSEGKNEQEEGGFAGLRIIDTKPQREIEPVKQGGAPRVRRRDTFQLPASSLFEPAPTGTVEVDRDAIYGHADKLEKTLADYGVAGKVVEVRPGPTVTMYEVACEAGTRVSKVASLADDLALGLSRKVRIIAPIPGKSLIGFELPNDERQPVCLRELIEDQRFEKLAERAPLPVVLGRDIVGAPYYADLASMPHVIVAGATGAGKSVGLNVMLSSLLYKRTPDELRLLMIDPKVVELAPFDGIPHMLLPVVTDMKQAATALRWAEPPERNQ
jgi:S-DNA-T family DNA segregation ATPase FtsK/SpoIIIE